MPKKRKQTEIIDPPLPSYGHLHYSMHSALVFAVSIAATMEGVHLKSSSVNAAILAAAARRQPNSAAPASARFR